MTLPPFKTVGQDGAEFFCLALAPVLYRQTQPPPLPATLGIYFCADQHFPRLNLISHAEDGSPLSYHRGNDSFDTPEFVFLSAFLDSSIHPAVWRLFPRDQIPSDFKSAPYEESRRN